MVGVGHRDCKTRNHWVAMSWTRLNKMALLHPPFPRKDHIGFPLPLVRLRTLVDNQIMVYNGFLKQITNYIIVPITDISWK